MSLEYKVGSIVALKSHPYFNDLTITIITGDPSVIPPLMIIEEIIRDTKTLYDERHGNPVSDKTQCQCKCIWYSHKQGQFEESWLSSKLLKIIESPNNLGRDEINIGMQVSLKTLDLEMSKHKSSLSYEGTSEIQHKTTITPLLSFVSPVMQILEIRKNEEKEPKYDPKTGEIKRFVPEYSVKCKWYNSLSDKLSEKFLPIESLTLIDEVPREALIKISNDIANGSHYRANNSLFKPNNITFRNSQYYIRGYDYVINKNIEIKISKDLAIADPVFLHKAPSTATAIKAEDTFADFVGTIKDAVLAKNYLRIKYKNRHDKITVRTLKDFRLHPKRNPKFLIGFCYNRKEERTFSIDRIINMQQLNLSYAKGSAIIETMHGFPIFISEQ